MICFVNQVIIPNLKNKPNSTWEFRSLNSKFHFSTSKFPIRVSKLGARMNRFDCNKNKRCHITLEGLSSVCAKLEPDSSKNSEILEINVLQKFTTHALCHRLQFMKISKMIRGLSLQVYMK